MKTMNCYRLCVRTLSAVILLLSNLSIGQTLFNNTQVDCGWADKKAGPTKALSDTKEGAVSREAATCTASSPAYNTKYKQQSFYVPTANDPVITVKITFHVFNKSDGTGSWPNTPQGVNDLTQIANWMHNWHDRYSDPRVANYTGPGFSSPHISDSKVNYELTNIYFYNDNTLNAANNFNYGTMFNYVNGIDPNRLNEGLPIFFNNGCYNGNCSGGGVAGYAQNHNGTPFVHSFIVAPPMGLFWCHEHLIHEIGHTMGWGHPYNNVNCTGDEVCNYGHPCTDYDFLSDVFPINNGCTTSLNCGACWENGGTYNSNNVMDGGLGNTWMSPLQMGRRIKNLHLNTNTPGPQTNIRKFAKEMISSVAGAWQITSSELWDFDIQMYQDIIVKPGATLTIKCKVAMANNGRIIVERGGKLVIDGGEISAWGRYWSGIQVWGTSNQPQVIAGNGLSVNHGIVQIINQGTIKDAMNAITTIKYDENGDWDWGGYTGGIIQCDGAKFINNIRAIQYLSYHNFNPANSNRIDNIGYIRRSLFETNGPLKDPLAPNPQVFISMWDVDGIKLYGNIYQNTRLPLPAIDLRGDGITSVDASYYVDRYKICIALDPNTGECVNYSTNVASTFSNLWYGVKVQNSTPATHIYISDNDFIGCNRSVYVAGTYNTQITKNRINVGQGQNNQQFLPYGIYSENSSAYAISNNSVFTTQTSNYNLSLGTGICVNGTNGLDNTIYRNTINMMGAGTTVYGDNQGPNPGDGLKLICNQFGQGINGKNYMDIYMAVTNNWVNGRIDKSQGSSAQGANNFFSHANNSNPNIKSDYGDNAFFLPGPAGSIQYYYNTISGQLTQPWYYDNSMVITALGAYNANMCPTNPNVGNPANRNVRLSKIITDKFSDPNGWNEEQITSIMKTDDRSVSTLDFLAKQNKENAELNANYKVNMEFEEKQKTISKLRSFGNSKNAGAQTLYNAIINDKYGEYISLPGSAGRIASKEEISGASSDLEVFPNPSNGIIKVKLNNAQKVVYTIEVFDVYGKLIYKQDQNNLNENEFNAEIALSGLNVANGLYVVNISSANYKATQKIAIQK